MLEKKRKLKFSFLLFIIFVGITGCNKDGNPVEETGLKVTASAGTTRSRPGSSGMVLLRHPKNWFCSGCVCT